MSSAYKCFQCGEQVPAGEKHWFGIECQPNREPTEPTEAALIAARELMDIGREGMVAGWAQIAVLHVARYIDERNRKEAEREAELERYQTMPRVTVGSGLEVIGEMAAISRVQSYIMLDSNHPVEKEDVRHSLARALQQAETNLRIANEYSAKLATDTVNLKAELAEHEATGIRRGVELAWDRVRGTNADLCKTPQAAYQTMVGALRDLRNQRELPANPELEAYRAKVEEAVKAVEGLTPFGCNESRHEHISRGAVLAILSPLVNKGPTRDPRIAAIIQEVAELPDRSSPDDWPEAMLVTADELAAILAEKLAPEIAAKLGEEAP